MQALQFWHWGEGGLGRCGHGNVSDSSRGERSWAENSTSAPRIATIGSRGAFHEVRLPLVAGAGEQKVEPKGPGDEDALLCRDYYRVARSIAFLRESASVQPSLDEVAAREGLSPEHFQRIFLRWAGVSPKTFLKYLTKEHAKSLLREGASSLEVCHATGLSGGGRLHDLLVSSEAVTPGTFARGGRELTILWGIHPSPYGRCLLSMTERGVSSLSFVDHPEEKSQALFRIARVYPEAKLREDEGATRGMVRQVFSRRQDSGPLGVQLRGSAFQLQVWQALMRLGSGELQSYGQLAAKVSRPGAARAVGTAMAENLVAVLVPCHRVIRAGGDAGQYFWGNERKRAMIARESALVGAK